MLEAPPVLITGAVAASAALLPWRRRKPDVPCSLPAGLMIPLPRRKPWRQDAAGEGRRKRSVTMWLMPRLRRRQWNKQWQWRKFRIQRHQRSCRNTGINADGLFVMMPEAERELARGDRFLCVDDAYYVTGQVLSVNGGMF